MTVLVASNRTESIPSWSFKELRARKNYACRNCGGIIVAGTKYLRHVERLGSRRGKDPLRNIHMHLDCHAPWYQSGDLPHRLRHVGQLPGKVPPPEVHDLSKAFIRPQIAVGHEDLGTSLWQLPDDVALRISFCPSPLHQTGAVGEIENVLSIVLRALAQSVGNKRKALILSHLINEIVAGLE